MLNAPKLAVKLVPRISSFIRVMRLVLLLAPQSSSTTPIKFAPIVKLIVMLVLKWDVQPVLLVLNYSKVFVLHYAKTISTETPKEVAKAKRKGPSSKGATLSMLKKSKP